MGSNIRAHFGAWARCRDEGTGAVGTEDEEWNYGLCRSGSRGRSSKTKTKERRSKDEVES